MLAYQSDAERNGSAVALNSNLLSGDVSGLPGLQSYADFFCLHIR